MICIKRYYYARLTKNTLVITPDILSLGPMPLIWENGGLYGIIRIERVENMLQLMKDKKYLPGLDSRTIMHVFYWDDVIIMDPKIAKILLNQS